MSSIQYPENPHEHLEPSSYLAIPVPGHCFLQAPCVTGSSLLPRSSPWNSRCLSPSLVLLSSLLSALLQRESSERATEKQRQ